MKKVVLVGAGGGGKRIFNLIKDKYEILCFWDNDESKNGTYLMDKPVYLPFKNKILDESDFYIISSMPGVNSIRKQLIEMGIEEEKIISSYVEEPIVIRDKFLYDFVKIVNEYGIEGSVAEAGVFQGEFAKNINKCFPDRKLYLFDTFEGFAETDIIIEKTKNYSQVLKGEYGITSEELVLNKMLYRDQCIIKKGIFPESAIGIEDKFCFVNLDMDLYKPTIEGLNFFEKRMSRQSIILVHDFFSEEYKGIKAAVSEFILGKKYSLVPIGDTLSIAVVGF